MKKSIASIIIAVVIFGGIVSPSIVRAEVAQQKTALQTKLELIKTLQALIQVLLKQLAEAQAREGIVVTTPVVTPTPINTSQTQVAPIQPVVPTTPVVAPTPVQTFTVTPPSDNTYYKAKSGLTLEQLRDFVSSLNNYVAWRDKMAQATEQQLVEALQLNGFTVVKK